MTIAKAKRGLAALSVEQRRQIAALGGKRAHQLGHAYEWTAETAAAAGRQSHRGKAKA